MQNIATRFSGHVYDRNSSVDSELSSWLSADRSSRLSSTTRGDSVVLSSPSRSPPRSPPAAAALPRLAAAPPKAQVITYSWDRNLSQGLDFGRNITTPARQALIPVYWRPGTDTLGITLDVETTTRQIIVTYSTRRDLRAGSILLRVASQRANEDNFHTLLLAAKAARGVTTCLEFAPAPAPVVVKKANYELALLGVNNRSESFELVAVDGCCVRYLSLQDINQRIHTASPACEMVFQRLAGTASDSHHRKPRSASDDAVLTTANNNRGSNGSVARGAGVATALAAVATIAGAMS
ncbi:hypothetical protein Gpo141_00000260 [Globisporangium polare]